MFTAVGDPSGKAKGSVYEETSFEALHRLGIPAFPAPSNDIEARIRGVEQMLLQQRDGGPAIVIDGTRCPMLVRALQGAYRFAKTKAGETKPLPEKSHPWSDLADGLQYVCLVFNAGLQSYMQRKIIAAGAKKERKKVSAAGWT